jgi:hypothetical protein
MSTDTERLDEANACHDAEPARAAELLRQLDAGQLPVERRLNYAYLINHVLGEKLSAWDEALTRQQQLIELALPTPQPALWRQLGAAALIVDAADSLARATTELVATSGALTDRAHELLALSAAMYRVPTQSSGDAAQTALQALAAITDSAWPTQTPLDAQAAACLNNIASGLLERPDADLQHGALRAVLARSAEQAQRLWQHAGTWVQHERAFYTRAVVCTALGEPHLALRHSLAGLALLDAHDSAHGEDVDRAFLELERWNACVWLGMTDDAADALSRADALATKFGDAGLTDEFEARRRRLPGFRR